MIKSVFGYKEGKFTELLLPSAGLTEFGRETSVTVLGKMTVCQALSSYGAENL